MDDRVLGLAVWLAVLLLALPYVRAVKHPASGLLAAWLIFALAFSVAAAVLFAVLSALAAATGTAGALDTSAGAAVFLLLVFLPAFALARWLAARPPARQPPLD